MTAEDALAGGIVGGVIGGAAGFKAGYDTGYRKKEQECQIVVGSLQMQLAGARQTIETQNKEIERLRKENQSLRGEQSILQRIKTAVKP